MHWLVDEILRFSGPYHIFPGSSSSGLAHSVFTVTLKDTVTAHQCFLPTPQWLLCARVHPSLETPPKWKCQVWMDNWRGKYFQWSWWLRAKSDTKGKFGKNNLHSLNPQMYFQKMTPSRFIQGVCVHRGCLHPGLVIRAGLDEVPRPLEVEEPAATESSLSIFTLASLSREHNTPPRPSFSGGHTHQPWDRRKEDTNLWLPGSGDHWGPSWELVTPWGRHHYHPHYAEEDTKALNH